LKQKFEVEFGLTNLKQFKYQEGYLGTELFDEKLNKPGNNFQVTNTGWNKQSENFIVIFEQLQISFVLQT
jgi:hypothetical protein